MQFFFFFETKHLLLVKQIASITGSKCYIVAICIIFKVQSWSRRDKPTSRFLMISSQVVGGALLSLWLAARIRHAEWNAAQSDPRLIGYVWPRVRERGREKKKWNLMFVRNMLSSLRMSVIEDSSKWPSPVARSPWSSGRAHQGSPYATTAGRTDF